MALRAYAQHAHVWLRVYTLLVSSRAITSAVTVGRGPVSVFTTIVRANTPVVLLRVKDTALIECPQACPQAECPQACPQAGFLKPCPQAKFPQACPQARLSPRKRARRPNARRRARRTSARRLLRHAGEPAGVAPVSSEQSRACAPPAGAKA
jgi:hypothetical protein